MADFENIVVEGTAEQLRNVLDGSAYTDQKMNQYGIQKAGYLSLQSKESDSADDIIDISPALSVKAEDGYPEYGILEIYTSQERSQTVLRGIHDAVNPDDATPLKQVKALLESEGNSNRKSVLYTEQNLTDEEKAQARQNIGAMKQPAESDSINFNSSELRNISSIKFRHRNEDGAQTGGVFVSSDENEIDENGEWLSRLTLEPADAGSVVIGGLHDGIRDADAATVRQVNEMIKNAASGTLSAEVIDNVLVVTLTGGLKASIENGVLVVA